MKPLNAKWRKFFWSIMGETGDYLNNENYMENNF